MYQKMYQIFFLSFHRRKHRKISQLRISILSENVFSKKVKEGKKSSAIPTTPTNPQVLKTKHLGIFLSLGLAKFSTYSRRQHLAKTA